MACETVSSRHFQLISLVSFTSSDPDWIEDHFETTPIMSTYVVAIFVSDYVSINGTTSNGEEVSLVLDVLSKHDTELVENIQNIHTKFTYIYIQTLMYKKIYGKK